MKKTALTIAAALITTACAYAAPTGDEGFTSIFNGKDLDGWDGRPGHWSVVDGVIRGDSTVQRAKGNTFLIWRKGALKNFELKLKFKIHTGNNSGIQYRSADKGNWVVSGYQAEVENKPGKVGFLYHEKGRGWLVDVGAFVEVDDKGKRKTVSKIADVEQLKKAPYYNDKDWNEYHFIARGNHVLHYLNGYPTVELIDNDKAGRCMEGILALQIHGGAPMTVDFKDIRVKHLDANYGEAVRIFNGENLDGWTVPFENGKNTWSVKDGVLHDTGKPAGYIRTIDDFTNYVLRMQLRHVTKGNSGVLVRMVGEDKVWPKSIEAQGMTDNMGDIWNIGDFPLKADAERTKGRRTMKAHPTNEKPLGEWNEYEIELNGGELKILVNRLLQNAGTEAWETPGKICLQAEGSEKEFRNIVIIPIH